MARVSAQVIRMSRGVAEGTYPGGTLFVLNSAGAGGAPSKRAAALVLGAVERGAVRARAVSVTPSDLRDRGVREALLARGLERLPALRPEAGRPLLGLKAIEAWLLAAGGRERPAELDDEEAAGAALEEYMQAQMRGAR